jgi:drug/metabolite transporter (DMT)-like permease
MNGTARGIAIMVAGLLVFAVLNGVVKDQAQRFPVTEIIFFRNLFGLLPLLIAVPFNGGWGVLKPRNVSGHLLQAVAMSITLVCAYVAFAMIPLAEATAIMFLQPVILVVLAHVFLKERASLSAWIAVVLGFAGVLLIARPADLGFEAGTLAALAGAFFAAVAIAQVRGLAATNTALTITIWYMVLSTLIFLPSIAFFWTTPSPSDLLALILMGIASGCGQFLIILPFRYATAATLGPVQYFSIVGGVLVGYFWFAEIPTWTTIAGAVIVMSAMALVLPRRGSKPADPIRNAVPLEET